MVTFGIRSLAKCKKNNEHNGHVQVLEADIQRLCKYNKSGQHSCPTAAIRCQAYMEPKRKPFGATSGDPAKNRSAAVTSGASFSLQGRHALSADIWPYFMTHCRAELCAGAVPGSCKLIAPAALTKDMEHAAAVDERLIGLH